MIKSDATSTVRIAMTWAITMITGFFLETQGMAAVTGAEWSRLAEKRIYFGHQSVGYNIIEGMREMMRENPSIRLRIMEGSDAFALAAPAFAHGTIGENTDVDSKLADFAKHLEKGIGEKADFAFMKFCYVDITEKSDAKSIFIRYQETMESLKKKYPGITFIHVTAPLTSKQRDLTTLAKNLVKRIIGRPVRTHRDNIPRNAFNEMMLQAYQGREPIFDLARIESTDREGKRLVLKEDGKSFHALVPEYTSDGGHLNEQGRRIAAGKAIYGEAIAEMRSPPVPSESAALYTRYPVLAGINPIPRSLYRLGVRRMYPNAILEAPAIKLHCFQDPGWSKGASEISGKLITLPTHRAISKQVALEVAKEARKTYA